MVLSQTCTVKKVEIVCDQISENLYDKVGSLLRCYWNVKDSTAFGSVVSSVVHTNKTTVKNVSQLKGLTITGAALKFIPFGIKGKFSNLKALLVFSTGLMSVTKENLKEFGKSLEHLDLQQNKIISINSDLFEYNINLKAIILKMNPLRHIDSDFFVNLKNLKYIELVNISGTTACMSQVFETEKGHDMANFMWNNLGCANVSAKIETQNLVNAELSNSFLHKNIDYQIMQIINNYNSEKLISTFTERFESLSKNLIESDKKTVNELATMKARVDSIELKMNNMTEAMNRLISAINHLL